MRRTKIFLSILLYWAPGLIPLTGAVTGIIAYANGSNLLTVISIGCMVLSLVFVKD